MTGLQARIAAELVNAVAEAVQKLSGLDADVTDIRPEPHQWTIKEVIGHLVDSAANNHQRFVRAQEVTELVFPKYEQRFWVQSQGYADCNWGQLLDFWQLYNEHLAHVIRRIPDDQLKTACVIGPFDSVTLEFLIEDYLDHLRHHLVKIDERVKKG